MSDGYVQRPVVRLMVCEGRCNPSLHDYDTTRGQLELGANNKDAAWLKRSFKSDRSRAVFAVVTDMVRTLRHTPHEMGRMKEYDPDAGWHWKWRCTVCGHGRR